MEWLFEAKKRFGLRVLNYMVTSNHIHLLLIDSGQSVISKSIQLIAGRTAQVYNQRKKRSGGYWEDRYHATAIETSEHLIKCLVYIDLNMVRTGVVKHPSEWEHSGYQEIQAPPKRYSIIDTNGLMQLCGIPKAERLRENHKEWVEEELIRNASDRESYWSESIAVGGKDFVEGIREQLGIRVNGKRIIEGKDHFELREENPSYSGHFPAKKSLLRIENAFNWKGNDYVSTG
jgi:REP element-mobilizing transposase RayT